jgi:thiol-disulfide isomerase/thioredoxin
MPLCNNNNVNVFNSNILGFNLWIWIIIIIIIFIIMNCNVENFKELFTETPKKQIKNIKIYNFYAEWCGYSMKFLPIWNEFESHVKDNLHAFTNVNIDEIRKITDDECNDNNSKYNGLCEKYNINGFPTVIFDIDGNIQVYNGDRSLDGLNNYLKNIN